MVFTPETKDELEKVIIDYLDNKEERIKKYGIMNDWNVSNITDMSYLFYKPFHSSTKFYVFNEYIGDWDVSNVTKMNYMFYMCDDFNQDISGWDVSKVTDMNHMFCNCKFNKPLNNWDVLNVTDMRDMFYNCDISEENKPVIPEKNIGVIKLYKELKPEEKEEHTECPISMDIYKEYTKVVITKCNHIFGYDGLKLWITSSNNDTCPYCRSTL